MTPSARLSLAALVLASYAGSTLANPPKTLAADALQTDAQKFSYAMGVDMATGLLKIKDDINIEALEAGLETIFAGQPSSLDPAQREQIKQTISAKFKQAQAAERTQLGERNQLAGAAFLAENGKRPGVKTTASGLQFEELQASKGTHPAASSTVKVHYEGRLITGEVFDSSVERGEPASFPLTGVIPGFTEGLQLMTVGSKAKIYLPGPLAYGPRGSGEKIGPNATLVFTITLLAIE